MFCHDVDASPKQLLEVRYEAAGEPGCRVRPGINQKIQVACSRRFATNNGPEDPHVVGTMTSRKFENVFSPSSDELFDSHSD